MGLVNAVVPLEELDAEVEKWCKELLEKSPTAIKMLKYAFHTVSVVAAQGEVDFLTLIFYRYFLN